MSIIDGRTLLDNADANTNWITYPTNALGAPSVDIETRVEGTGSLSTFSDNTSGGEGIAFDNGSDRDWTDDVVYMWVNIANPGLMETKANGGIRVRVANNAGLTNFVERNFEGSDTYSGGWRMFIIDMNDVFQNADNTGGTPPVITAARYVGITLDLIAGAMPKMQDNMFMDACWRLQKGVPGIRVEADNGGSPWTWQDIVDAGDIFDVNKAWGHILQDQGNITLFSSIEFGDAAGVTSTDFVDTSGANVKFGQGANPLPDDIYEVTFVGNGTGTTDIDFGSVVGSGDDRQGIGGTSWGTGGPLYTIDGETDIADLDTLNFYGGGFVDAGVIALAGASKTDVIGASLVGCGEFQPNDAEALNCFVIGPSDRGIEMLTTHNIKQITHVAGDNVNQVATFGTRTDNSSATPSDPHTFSHTVASGEEDVALLLMIGFEHTADDILSVTYDGNPLRKIGEISNGTTVTCEAWILYNPPEGSSLTVSIDFDAAPDNIAVSAINLEGVNRFSEISFATGTASAATALGTTLGEASFDTYTVDIIYTDVSGPGTTFDATGGTATEIVDAAVGGEAAVAVAEDTGGTGLRDHDWTWTGSAIAAQLVVAIKSIGVEHHIHFPLTVQVAVTFEGMQFFGFGADGSPKWHGEDSEAENIISAGSFVIGSTYKIVFVGTTDFVAIGAASDTIGVIFTATGVGSGTGTASEVSQVNTTEGSNPDADEFEKTGNPAADVQVTSSETVTFEAVDKLDAAIQDVLITAYLISDDSEVINAVTNASGIATTSFAKTVPADIYYRYRKSSTGATKFINLSGFATIASGTGVSVKRSMTVDTTADPAI